MNSPESNGHSPSEFNRGLLDFLGASPTPFHAVAQMAQRLEANGFRRLEEGENWNLERGGRYYLTRNQSSLIAFVHGQRNPAEVGIRLVGAHTDSPCLMAKPRPDLKSRGYWRLGVEVYGGALLNPWFDRDLSIAGRLVYQDAEGGLRSQLVDFRDPVAVIPSLAIHLDRQANDGRTVNPQTDISPLISLDDGSAPSFRELLAQRFLDGGESVLDCDLYFYDTQPPAQIGLRGEFVASARLDNLLSCHAGLEALLTADGEHTGILVCNDHEEVGSASACGAQGPMLANVLERLIPDPDQRFRAINRSLLISTDNAHAVHPNYPAKHDDNHLPVINGGPVVKINARQRYATTGLTGALFRQMAQECGVALQDFVSRNDMPCGSTIGPITATEVGVPTLDVGVPTFAMHSVRELAGSEDGAELARLLAHFFNRGGVPVVSE